jgi:predicted transcriptional regulator
MQIMTDKGLVKRDERQRAHVYQVTQSADQTRQNLVTHLLDRAFDGSAGRLVMQALSTRTASAKELEEIRRLLDDMEGKRQ